MTQNKNKPSIWHVFQGGSLTDTPSTDLCLSGHILTGHPFTSQLLHFLHLLSARVAPHSIHLNGGTCHRGPQSIRDWSQDVLGGCKIFCWYIPVSLSSRVTRPRPPNSSRFKYWREVSPLEMLLTPPECFPPVWYCQQRASKTNLGLSVFI